VSLDGSKSKNNLSHKSLSNEAANLNNLSNLPFYNCSQPDLVNELIETNLNSDYIECIKNLNDQDFTLIHLNINSLYLKRDEINEILNLNTIEILSLNETKTDDSIPDAFFQNNNYQTIRLDRNKQGGGILVFIKNEYKILKQIKLDKIEAIYFQLQINGVLNNFISCYKSPSLRDTVFLNELEDFIFTLDLDINLVIIGDLNMDLLEINQQNTNLIDFLLNNNLNQAVKKPTRICAKYYERTGQINCSKTLIDVLIHNNDFVKQTYNINCPFSDHKFIMAKLKVKKEIFKSNYFIGRKLSAKNIDLIVEKITMLNHIEIMEITESHQKWMFLKEKLLETINSVAPIEKIKILKSMNYPWVDLELIEARQLRDKLHKTFVNTESADDYLWFNEAKVNYNKLLKIKMIAYFQDKTANDFKNSKKYWQFYQSSVKLKTGIKKSSTITITKDNQTFTDPTTVGNIFNTHFTSLSSESEIEFSKCSDFVNDLFDKIETERSINNKNVWLKNGFQFQRVNCDTVLRQLSNLSSTSGPGACGIPSKILKAASFQLAPLIKSIFNTCIDTNNIPDEWKLAIVSPIFKNKGSNEDVNNYRGISVISPIAKLFEKILAEQIIKYLNENDILFAGQHGFRNQHSCETALHEIINEMNTIRSNRKIGLYLFIDFRKAFDLVDSNILLLKLKRYGFNTNALLLIKSYFSNRKQQVKIDGIYSMLLSILLSVPQGSVLGPLFFLLFINDFAMLMKNLTCVLFADDTTLSKSGHDLDELVRSFDDELQFKKRS